MKLALTLCFIICTNIIFSQKDTNEVFENDDYFLKQLENNESNKRLVLEAYSIDSCLLKELKCTISNDSTCYFYIKQQSAYSFSLTKRDSVFFIKIIPIYLHHITENNNYKGYFEAFNRKFLIYGQISDSTFKKNDNHNIEIEYYNGKDIIDSYILSDIKEYDCVYQCNKKLFYLSFIPINCYSPQKKNSIDSQRNKRWCHLR